MSKLFLIIAIAGFLGGCKLGGKLPLRDRLDNYYIDYLLFYNNRRASHTPYVISASAWDKNTLLIQYRYQYFITSRSLKKESYVRNKKMYDYILIEENSNKVEINDLIPLSKLDSLVINKTIYYLDSLRINNYDILKRGGKFVVDPKTP